MSNIRLSKVIFLGDSAVGKTSLLNSYVDQKFFQSYKATIGADFMETQILADGKIIKLEIWDTAGQQRFKAMGGAFYRGSDCCVLVYDITKRQSFYNIQQWMSEFLRQRQPNQPNKFPFVLIGNKVDKQIERQVLQSEVDSFLNLHPNVKHISASAKDSSGVKTAFQLIATTSIQNRQLHIWIPIQPKKIYINSKDKSERNRKKCC